MSERSALRAPLRLALRLPSRWAIAIAGGALAVDLVIALSTVLPGAPIFAQWPAFAVFPLLFVLHARSVALMERGDIAWRDLATPWKASYLALFILAMLIAMLSILSVGGVPEQHHGAYFLDDHGALIPASHAEYEHAQVLQQRIFTLIPGAFFAAALVVNLGPPWGIARL